MKYLALDVGRRRTGLAFFDSATAIVLPITTLTHQSREELVDEIMKIIASRTIDTVVVGLPLLLSGAEGSQVEFVRSCAALLQERSVKIVFQDERYTFPRSIYVGNL